MVHDHKMRIVEGDTNQGHYQADIWWRKRNKVTREEPAWPPRGLIGGPAVKDARIWLLSGGTCDKPRRPDKLFCNEVWSSKDGTHWVQNTEAALWHPLQYH